MSGRRRRGAALLNPRLRAALATVALMGAVHVAARSVPPQALPPSTALSSGWGSMTLDPGGPVSTRPAPPLAGRTRCIGINTIAGAQMFGDRGIELTMKGGQRYRMFLGRDCPALSFYQGFYYRRAQAGTLCAGRDVIGARSGGECPIASIIPVRRIRR